MHQNEEMGGALAWFGHLLWEDRYLILGSRMFEHRNLPLLPRARFALRVIWVLIAGLSILACSLGIGMVGYHVTEGLSWVDSYANAAMILSGMGPLTALQSESGKIFAGSYALFSGLAFITAIGVFLAPIVHRTLHRFHLEAGESDETRTDS